jgi:hypothetical protein
MRNSTCLAPMLVITFKPTVKRGLNEAAVHLFYINRQTKKIQFSNTYYYIKLQDPTFNGNSVASTYAAHTAILAIQMLGN